MKKTETKTGWRAARRCKTECRIGAWARPRWTKVRTNRKTLFFPSVDSRPQISRLKFPANSFKILFIFFIFNVINQNKINGFFYSKTRLSMSSIHHLNKSFKSESVRWPMHPLIGPIFIRYKMHFNVFVKSLTLVPPRRTCRRAKWRQMIFA